MGEIKIDSSHWSLQKVNEILNANASIALDQNSRNRVVNYRQYIEKKINEPGPPIYGINTGFGSLCNVEIAKEELDDLQINLVRSHACGMGDEVEEKLVKTMLLLKAKSLQYGNSGVRPELIDQICAFYNNNVIPQIFEQGSLGASGDLAPLAHLSLPLLGEGKAYFKGQLTNGEAALNALGLNAITLKAKEGLALLNGTQFMLSYATNALIEGWKIWRAAHHIATLSCDAFLARTDAFLPQLHAIRPHEGQVKSAALMLELYGDSELSKIAPAVQDHYSFRCTPQVMGASYGALKHATQVIETELNSVTDNPNIFPEDDLVVSGGNFHGQHLALALDYIAIALAEIANISERRTYLMVGGHRNLPAYLTKKPGTQSGFMIPQYAAASIVSQNKQLCTPASVDSIVSSNGQEDHVSMGANAATKCWKVVKNCYSVLGIELLTSAQALEFRDKTKASSASKKLLGAFREKVTALDSDRFMHPDQQRAAQFVAHHFEFEPVYV
ncbi:MAG: histidine ammonia-lyase [Bacteroidetes bacterium]|nr:histidine ammonia-lyase [Bacteroidota bacterium]